MRFVFLRVSEGREVPLGVVRTGHDVPELLRHVAGHYESHPDELLKLLSGPLSGSAPAYVADPFGVACVPPGELSHGV